MGTINGMKDDGYTIEQSRELLLRTQRQNPGPYFYLGCTPMTKDGAPDPSFPIGKFFDSLTYARDAIPSANLITLYKAFRRDCQQSGRWGIWVMAGDPVIPTSPMLMLDTAWLQKAMIK